GTWGTKLNTDMDLVDTQMKVNEDAAAASQTIADAALPVAGGAMTGGIDVFTSRSLYAALGSISTTQDLDFALANAFTFTVGAAVTLSFTNVPTADDFIVGAILKITNGGAFFITWPAAVNWVGGVTPTFTTSGTDLVALVSFDDSATWQANVLLDVK
ncbi:hypothetical protein LCGC14_2468590, partial [marine sediment metagenome]